MHHPAHKSLKAAYSFYNIHTETPLLDLMSDALIIAKSVSSLLFFVLCVSPNMCIKVYKTSYCILQLTVEFTRRYFVEFTRRYFLVSAISQRKSFDESFFQNFSGPFPSLILQFNQKDML